MFLEVNDLWKLPFRMRRSKRNKGVVYHNGRTMVRFEVLTNAEKHLIDWYLSKDQKTHV